MYTYLRTYISSGYNREVYKKKIKKSSKSKSTEKFTGIHLQASKFFKCIFSFHFENTNRKKGGTQLKKNKFSRSVFFKFLYIVNLFRVEIDKEHAKPIFVTRRNLKIILN